MAKAYILAIDQGTTSTRAAIYDGEGTCLGSFAQEFPQYYPQPGWVEHDADEIWQTVTAVVPRALEAAGIESRQVACIGITNQRETSVLWERASGRTVGRAIVWQDRRTADFCRDHKNDEPWITSQTGLVLDPYFSATKLRWLLDRAGPLRAKAGKLAWGTIDSFLIGRLTAGQVHATDVTNASRTLLLNLKSAAWDPALCRYFNVPADLLPEVRSSAAEYGKTSGLGFLPDGVPILGVAGDQQAALFGQRAFAAGEAKCTYGTGAFFLMHTGTEPSFSRHRLIATFAATLGAEPQYALEGSIFVAGAAVQWLRDGLRLIDAAGAVEDLAARADPDQRLVFVPALVGLGAPHWVPEAQGVLFGLTRGTTAAELSRAVLEGVAFQVADLIDAARADAHSPLPCLRVDGGMARNSWFLQCQANVLGLPVIRAGQSESTALGAAYLAGLRAGIWADLDALRRLPDPSETFEPRIPEDERRQRQSQWRRAVQSVIGYYGRGSHAAT